MTKAEQKKTGLKGQDKSQGDLRGGEKELPKVSSASARVHTTKTRDAR